MHCEELEKEWKEKLAEWDKHMRGEIQDIKPQFSLYFCSFLVASYTLILVAHFQATKICGWDIGSISHPYMFLDIKPYESISFFEFLSQFSKAFLILFVPTSFIKLFLFSSTGNNVETRSIYKHAQFHSHLYFYLSSILLIKESYFQKVWFHRVDI